MLSLAAFERCILVLIFILSQVVGSASLLETMVKSCGYGSSIPAWTKLPQYKDCPVIFGQEKDEGMEGIEVAMEEKLVLPQGPRLKRSRTDVGLVVDDTL